MELTRFAFVIDAVPIEHAVCRVAVLLYLDQDIAAADSVKPSRRQKHCIALSHANAVKMIGGGAGAERFLKLIARCRSFEADRNFPVRFGPRDVPTFRFRLPPRCWRAF